MDRSAVRGFATTHGWMATAGMVDHPFKPTSESKSIHHGVGGNLRTRGILRLTVDAYAGVFKNNRGFLML
jgi:hypothetical protein